METPAANKMGDPPSDKYRRRWPRAVPAFEAECRAADRFGAEREAFLADPTPERYEVALAEAERLREARQASVVACQQDEDEFTAR